MPTPYSRVIPVTDDRGHNLLPEDEGFEPLPGSIVLTEGLFGTAWQRFFSDGLWHRAGSGGTATWQELLSRRNVVLVYDATERDQGRRAS